MWQKLGIQLAIYLFKTYLLSTIRVKQGAALNKMSDRIVESKRNPINYDTIGDVREKADKALDEIFSEFGE